MAIPPRIPLSVPVLGEAEGRNLMACVEENELTRGRFVSAFERTFADFHDQSDAVSTSSGTAALHLAMVELAIGPGDEVIVPALTFVATANVIRYVGATPVFADVDPETYCITVESVAACVGPATKAVIVVDLYGHPVDLHPILELARVRGFAVVEDATEALGSRLRGRLCGTLADIACFSFNGNKVVTSAGGGMLLASEERLTHLRYLARQAREPGREYVHEEIGFNYALSNVHAAIGLGQMERLDELLAARRLISDRYREALADIDGLTFCREASWATSNFWLMSVLVDAKKYGEDRNALTLRLDRSGIDSRPFFYPLPLLRPFRELACGDFPTARFLHASGLSIPSSANLSHASLDRVIQALRGD